MSTAATLRQIRDELRELRHLYKQLVERLLPTDTLTEEEARAVDEPARLADERAIRRALRAS